MDLFNSGMCLTSRSSLRKTWEELVTMSVDEVDNQRFVSVSAKRTDRGTAARRILLDIMETHQAQEGNRRTALVGVR